MTFRRSIKILRSQFETIALTDQDILASSAKRAKFVTMIPDESIKSYFIQFLELRNQIAELWSDEQLESVAKPADFWKIFVELYEESSTVMIDSFSAKFIFRQRVDILPIVYLRRYN